MERSEEGMLRMGMWGLGVGFGFGGPSGRALEGESGREAVCFADGGDIGEQVVRM